MRHEVHEQNLVYFIGLRFDFDVKDVGDGVTDDEELFRFVVAEVGHALHVNVHVELRCVDEAKNVETGIFAVASDEDLFPLSFGY